MKSFVVLQTLFVDELPLTDATSEPLSSVVSHVTNQVAFGWKLLLTLRTLEGVDAPVDGVDMSFEGECIMQLFSTHHAGKFGSSTMAMCVLPSGSWWYLQRHWTMFS